ncbi:hypothetical protein Mag101_02700 [Microbulbifer agarilyticus]|uniref:Uncharacterized protein n=1 Tax=Microbulbifer agarilyticus TaxID=260552 RepID=A0A1Q2M1Y1_9GAMM|nr:hypothetical protein [Microbulbifer agarilyticus]AQQ66676.1 hypothetical protein Mag101_02700 [Microbulbifer agarilyticus]
MSAFSATRDSQRNALYNLAAVGAVLLGLLLVLGARGHFVAVWPLLSDDSTGISRRLLLILPGVMLAGTAALNLLLCKSLWQRRDYAINLTLAANLIAAVYLIYLMVRGVPGHPIGTFLALETSFVILLAGIRFGLVWPAIADVEKY